MPSSEAILSSLTETANDWQILAIGWHVFFAALLLAIASRARLSDTCVRHLLVLPLVSVSALAWISGNPFNGTVFAALALFLVAIPRGRPARFVGYASTQYLIPGVMLVVFGWVYPHFLHARHWTAFAFAAPLGLVPCPTLSAVIGITLILDMFRPKAWSLALAATGIAYGAIGVFVLGVTLDIGLLAGAIVLAGAVARELSHRSVRASRDEHARHLPGDELIPKPLGTLTHAITIQRPPEMVWPWLAQMGAGSRGGWYSYDFLDNGRRPSAERIVPEWQPLQVGMVFPALPGSMDGFTVLGFEQEDYLVLGWRSPDGAYLVTWAFVLDDAGSNSTRLITRARRGPGYTFHGLPWWLAKPIVRLVHFVMQRRQLHGIAARAEA